MVGKRGKKVILLIVSIVFALILAELFLRVYYTANDRILGADESEICNKRAYMIARGDKLASDGPITLRFPNYIGYSPILGIRPIPNSSNVYLINESLPDGTTNNLFYLFHMTDSRGINSGYETELRKKTGTTRIAILGDSFTWGNTVPLKFTYPSVLEALIKNSEVLNFGVEGVGVDYMLLRWQGEVRELKPDIVIFGIYIDDVKRSMPCIFKPYFIKTENGLSLQNQPPPDKNKILESFKLPVFESYLIKHVRYTIKYWRGTDRILYEEGFSLLDVMLDYVKKEISAEETFFSVLVIERGNDDDVSETEEWAISELKQMLTEKEIPYVSSDDIFEKEGYVPTKYINGSLDYMDEYRFANFLKLPLDHFTGEGYALVAHGLKNFLEEQDVIPKQPDYDITWDYRNEILRLNNKRNTSSEKWIVPFIELNS